MKITFAGVRYYLAARISLRKVDKPAALLSQEVTVAASTNIGVETFCYNCTYVAIKLAKIDSSGTSTLAELNWLSSYSRTLQFTQLPAGTFKLLLTVTGVGVIYIDRIFTQNNNAYDYGTYCFIILC